MPQPLKPERNKEVCRRREEGESFTTIARAVGISRTRVIQILRRQCGWKSKGELGKAKIS